MGVYSIDQIRQFESVNSLAVPARLAAFLAKNGPGLYGDILIHPLEEILAIHTDFFDNPGELLTRWLPFGCNNRTQEVWVLDISGPTARFARIWHETVPDDWADEDWQVFADTTDSETNAIGL